MSKKKRQKDTLTDERDEDLFSAYERVIKKHGEYAKIMPRSQLIQEAIESQPKRFYISNFTAKLIINRMMQRPTPRVIINEE